MLALLHMGAYCDFMKELSHETHEAQEAKSYVLSRWRAAWYNRRITKLVVGLAPGVYESPSSLYSAAVDVDYDAKRVQVWLGDETEGYDRWLKKTEIVIFGDDLYGVRVNASIDDFCARTALANTQLRSDRGFCD